MSYYMDLAGEVNDSPREDDFAHYPSLERFDRARRYSSEYEADQWFATREAPRKPHLLKTEKEAHAEAVAFVLESREAARAKKAFPGAIPSRQSVAVNQPKEAPAKPSEKKPAVPAPAPEAPEPAGLPAPVRRSAQVVEAPAGRDQSEYFRQLPPDNDWDGGVIDPGYSAQAQEASPFAGVEWRSVAPEGPAPQAKASLPPLKYGEKPAGGRVALKLRVDLCPATNRYICRQVGRLNHAAHGNSLESAVRGMVKDCGGLADNACASIRYVDADLTFYWSPILGEIFSESDRPDSPGKRLEEAAKRGDVGGMRSALADGPSETATQWALDAAAEAGNALDCLYLIQQGADPAARHSAALGKAAVAGHAETCRLLIEHGASSAGLRDAEKAALMKCLLVDAHPDRSESQADAFQRLSLAASRGEVEWMGRALAGLSRDDLAARNHAMMMAVGAGQAKAVAYLLDQGVPLSWDGSRTLEQEAGLALHCGRFELASLYVERGADPAKMDFFAREKWNSFAATLEAVPCS